jgi:ribosomal protein S18 acetylase RimI-like enzyme
VDVEYLLDSDVHSNYQRCGIGSELVKHVEDALMRLDVWYDATQELRRAIRLECRSRQGGLMHM